MLPTFMALFGYIIKQEGSIEKAVAWVREHSKSVQHLCPTEGANEFK